MSAEALPFMALIQKSTKNLVNRTIYPKAKATIPANSWVGIDLYGEAAPVIPVEANLTARFAGPITTINALHSVCRGINRPDHIHILYTSATYLTIKTHRISDFAEIGSCYVDTATTITSRTSASMDICNDGGVDKVVVAYVDTSDSSYIHGRCASWDGVATWTLGTENTIQSTALTSLRIELIGGKYFWFSSSSGNRMIKIDLATDISTAAVISGVDASCRLLYGSVSPPVLVLASASNTYTCTWNVDTCIATKVNTTAGAQGIDSCFTLDASDPTSILTVAFGATYRIGRYNQNTNTFTSQSSGTSPTVHRYNYTTGLKIDGGTVFSVAVPVSKRHFMAVGSSGTNNGFFSDVLMEVLSNNTLKILSTNIYSAYVSASEKRELGTVLMYSNGAESGLVFGNMTDGVTNNLGCLCRRGCNALYGFCKDGAAADSQATVILSGVIEGTGLPTGKYYITANKALSLVSTMTDNSKVGVVYFDWFYMSKGGSPIAFAQGTRGQLSLVTLSDQLKAEG